MTPFFRRLRSRRAARRRVEREYPEAQREYPEARTDYIRTSPPRPSRWWWRVGFTLIPVAVIVAGQQAQAALAGVLLTHIGCVLRAARLDSKLK